jgi:hypothetical protein
MLAGKEVKGNTKLVVPCCNRNRDIDLGDFRLNKSMSREPDSSVRYAVGDEASFSKSKRFGSWSTTADASVRSLDFAPSGRRAAQTCRTRSFTSMLGFSRITEIGSGVLGATADATGVFH